MTADTRQAAIDALAAADHGYQHVGREPMSECPFREDFIRRAARIIDYLDADPEAAAALRAYLPDPDEDRPADMMGCGCALDAHPNTLPGMKAAHPDMWVPDNPAGMGFYPVAPSPFDRIHWGRAWSGHDIEDACPCPQEPCGLVSEPAENCDQHRHAAARTMRQGHRENECPTVTTTTATLTAEPTTEAGRALREWMRSVIEGEWNDVTDTETARIDEGILAIEAEAVADYRAQNSYPEDDVRDAVNAERRRIAEAVRNDRDLFRSCGGFGCDYDRKDDLTTILDIIEGMP